MCPRSTGPDNTEFQVTGLTPGQTYFFVARTFYTVSGATDSNTVVQQATTADINAKLVWHRQPHRGKIGLALPTQPIIKLVDKGTQSLITGFSMVVEAQLILGDGSLSNTTVNLGTNGYAYFVDLSYDDFDPAAPDEFQLRVSADGVDSSDPSDVLQNAFGACLSSKTGWKTFGGGCMHTATGYIFSRRTNTTYTWH